MSDASADRERARRSFLEAPPATPFLKTPEGRRLVLLALLLCIAGPLLYFQYRRAEARVAEAQAQRAMEAEAAAAPERDLEERLAAKREALATRAEGAFNDTQNGDDFVETAGYSKLIELLASSTPDDVTARSLSHLDHAAAMSNPDLGRGEFVRVRGLLGGLFAVKLERPVHGITDVWRGSISQPDGETDPVVFDLIGEPPDVVMQRTVVEIDGLFYRLAGYEAKNGKQALAPYMLVRNLRAIDVQHASSDTSKFLAIAVGIGLIIVYLVLRASIRTRGRRAPRPPGFKQLFEERRERPDSRP